MWQPVGPATRVLSSWATGQHPGTADLGPAVLAVLLAQTADRAAHDAVRSALPVWLASAVRPVRHPGLYGGMAGVLVGVRLIAGLHPPAHRLVARVRGWLTLEPGNHDLIGGLAGIALAGVDQAREHLKSLRLSDFRLRDGIDTGLAHGVSGVITALPSRELADWLITESYRDELGVVSWSPRVGEGVAPPSGVMRRQAWCYGTPGIAWALWSAGARAEAVEAMRSCCAAYDFEVHLYGEEADQLGICHGAAGVLLIADAFARHAKLAEAAKLRDRLVRYLVDRMDQIVTLGERDCGLLMGATGVLAALLTAAGGNRDWLPCLGIE